MHSVNVNMANTVKESSESAATTAAATAEAHRLRGCQKLNQKDPAAATQSKNSTVLSVTDHDGCGNTGPLGDAAQQFSLVENQIWYTVSSEMQQSEFHLSQISADQL